MIKYKNLHGNLKECKKAMQTFYKAADTFIERAKIYEKLPIPANFIPVHNTYTDLVIKNSETLQTITKLQAEVSELLLK